MCRAHVCVRTYMRARVCVYLWSVSMHECLSVYVCVCVHTCVFVFVLRRFNYEEYTEGTLFVYTI